MSFKCKIDNTGRFVIPKKVLRELNWLNTKNINVDVIDSKIILSSGEPRECLVCKKVFESDYKYCPYCRSILCKEKQLP